uniref:Uncharacterized protein n=1 Tax=Amphiprion percula TaxID=161767 RepID=A0A3P8T3C4_AMPPE
MTLAQPYWSFVLFFQIGPQLRSCWMCTKRAGAYILQIFDHYVCSGPTLLLMAIFQSVTIGWIYGAERFCDNIEDMIGYKPLSLIKYCWLYGTPLICSVRGTLVFLLLRYTPLRFNNSYVYPWWAYWIGWFLAMSSLSLIPITMICKLVKGEGSLLQVSDAVLTFKINSHFPLCCIIYHPLKHNNNVFLGAPR